MRIRAIVVRVMVLTSVCAVAHVLQAGVISSDSARIKVQRVVQRQLDNRETADLTSQAWQTAAFYAGVIRAAGVTGDPTYFEAMRSVGELTGWSPGKQSYHADHHVIGMLYFDLLKHYGESAYVAPMLERFDFILANPSTRGVDNRYTSSNPSVNGLVMRWWWCDALFMAPPVWTEAWLQTGNRAYRDFMVQEWKATDDLLYSAEHQLYYRDATKFNIVGPDGQPEFWGRGNGWVMGGLAELLKKLPLDDPDRPWFIARFQAMASTLLQTQRADGSWGMDLLNPSGEAHGESTTTAFFCYALLYGVNSGVLERSTYLPVAEAAWNILNTYLTAEGRLTYAQPSASGPSLFNVSNSELYGTGAFAIAGTEMFNLCLAQEYDFSLLTVTNSGAFGMLTSACPLAQFAVYNPGATRSLQLRSGQSGEVIESMLLDSNGDGLPDTLYFNDAFLAGQFKEYRVFAELSQQWDANLTKGLLHWWKLDDTNNLTYVDQTGGADLTAYGAISSGAGKIGGAAELTTAYGSSERLESAAITNNLAYYTIAGWIKISTAYANQFPRIFECDQFALMLRDSGAYRKSLDFVARNTTGDTFREWSTKTSDPTSKIEAGNWYHVAAVYNPRQPTWPPNMYINGVLQPCDLVANKGGTVQRSSTKPYVIGNNPAYNRSFPGKLDDFRLYNRLLSVREITELYRLNAPGAPTVNAGQDQIIHMKSVTLAGSITDNGLQTAGKSVRYAWSVASAPAGGSADIEQPNLPITKVTFSATGIYQLVLQADNGFEQGADSVTIEVMEAVPQPGNLPPVITLATNHYHVILPCGVELQATAVNPDSVPVSNQCSTVWRKLSGPGDLRFTNPDKTTTTAWFSEAGTYTLEIAATDGQDVVTQEVTVTVADGTPLLRWYTIEDREFSILHDSARGVDAPVNIPAFAAGRIGDAFMSSADAMINFDMPAAETLTIATWVYHNATTIDWPRVMATADEHLYLAIMFSGGENAITYFCQQESGTKFEYKTPAQSFLKEEWVHLAVVHDRRSFSTPIIYINGVEQSIAPRAAGNPALPFIPYGSRATIGNRATSDRGFNGLIDDFRVYGALLTSGEIVQIMEEGARPKYAVYPTGNQAPEVEFMPVADAQRGKPLPLNAVITDDGLLLGVVNVRWRKLSGAGAVTFSAPCQAESQALFSNSGSYVLELSVEDGEKTTVRNLYVNVKDTGSIVIIK